MGHPRMHYTRTGLPKQAFSRKRARQIARELSDQSGQRVNAYQCWCQAYHVGRAS